MIRRYRRYKIGRLMLDTKQRLLVTENGEEISIGPKDICVLCMLAKRCGSPVQAIAIEEKCEIKSANALEKCIGRLRAILEPYGAEIPHARAATYRLHPVCPAFGERIRELLAQSRIEAKDLVDLMQHVGKSNCATYQDPVTKDRYFHLQGLFESVPGDRYMFGLPGSPWRTHDMTTETASYLYEKRFKERPPTPAELEALAAGVNERAKRLRALAYSGSHVHEFLPIDDFLTLITTLLFVRTKQPVCELQERLNTILRWVKELPETYHVYLVSTDLRLDRNHFFLKEYAFSEGRIYLVVRLRGAPDEDVLEITVCNNANEEGGEAYRQEMEVINGWIRDACDLSEYPNVGSPSETVFRVDSSDEFFRWLSDRICWDWHDSPFECVNDLNRCAMRACPKFEQRQSAAP